MIKKFLIKKAQGTLKPIGLLWYFILEVTGVMEEFCRRKHQSHHQLKQVELNGTSVVWCSKCYRQFIRK